MTDGTAPTAALSPTLAELSEHGGLVGRAEDLAQLIAVLSEARVITLVGPGGAGKTRLAHALAATVGERPGGPKVVFADLTEAVTLEGALGAIAGALGAGLGTANAETGIEVAAEVLAARGDLLLILDNLEQLGETAGTLVSAWVERVPTLTVLGTSRSPIGAAGERRVELPPLSPERAIELFLARAADARSALKLNDADRALLREIVDALDRLPLAIELAAARLEVLTLTELKERLARDPEVLARPDREGRHGAMRTVLDASWRLLSAVERTALASLSVFRGGFELDAAQAVLGQGVSALDLVHALKRKSLIQAAAGGERQAMRYRLLETVRQLAAEKLEQGGGASAKEAPGARGDAGDDYRSNADAREVVRRHAEYFGQRSIEGLRSRDFTVLSDDIENLAAAVERGAALAPAAAARASLALDLVIASRGPLAARRRFLDAGYEAAEAAGDLELVARLLIARGDAARVQGEIDSAIIWIERAIEIAAELDDGPLRGRARSALGTAYFFQGDTARAQELWDHALLDLDPDTANVDRGIVLARLFALPIARGVFDLAHSARGREALDIFRKAGERRWENIARMNLAVLYSEVGELDRAEELLLQGLHAGRAVGDRISTTMYVFNLGLLELDRGDGPTAQQHLREAMADARETGDGRAAGIAAGCLGIALALEGQAEAAVPLLAEGRQVAEARGEAPPAALFAAWSAVVRGVSIPALGPEAKTNESFTQAVRILAGSDETPAGIHPRIAARYRKKTRSDAAGPALTLLHNGLRFRVDGAEEVDLSRRGSLRRMLLAFVDAREKTPGTTLDVHQLLDAGWPGERVLPEAGANRVYTAIRHLRNMGMKDVLVTRDGGYLLAPDVTIQRED